MFVDDRDEKTTTSGRTDKTTNTNTLPKCSSLPRLLVRLSVCLLVCLSLLSLSSLKSYLYFMPQSMVCPMPPRACLLR